MPKSWERLPRETARAFASFQKFLDLGPERSLKLVAEETGLKTSQLSIWSSKFKWRDRATDWEDFLADAQQKSAKKILEKDSEKWAKRRVALREQEFDIAEKLFKKAHEILELPLVEKIVEEIDEETGIPTVTIHKPIKVTLRDAANAASIASQLKRLSAEMETSKTKTEVTVTTDAQLLETAYAVLGKLRDEILAEIAAASGVDRIEKEKQLQLLPALVAKEFNINPDSLQETNAPKEVEAEELVNDNGYMVPQSAIDLVESESGVFE